MVAWHVEWPEGVPQPSSVRDADAVPDTAKLNPDSDAHAYTVPNDDWRQLLNGGLGQAPVISGTSVLDATGVFRSHDPAGSVSHEAAALNAEGPGGAAAVGGLAQAASEWPAAAAGTKEDEAAPAAAADTEAAAVDGATETLPTACSPWLCSGESCWGCMWHGSTWCKTARFMPCGARFRCCCTACAPSKTCPPCAHCAMGLCLPAWCACLWCLPGLCSVACVCCCHGTAVQQCVQGCLLSAACRWRSAAAEAAGALVLLDSWPQAWVGPHRLPAVIKPNKQYFGTQVNGVRQNTRNLQYFMLALASSSASTTCPIRQIYRPFPVHVPSTREQSPNIALDNSLRFLFV